MEAAMEMVARVTRTSSSVKINEHQCKRLAQVYEEIGTHLSQKRIESSVNMEPLLKVMEAGELLVSQCAGPDWFQTALVNAENKEAFEELHGDLHLWFGTIFSTELIVTSKINLTTDAIHDAKAMLVTLENIQRQGGQKQFSLTVAIFTVNKRGLTRFLCSKFISFGFEIWYGHICSNGVFCSAKFVTFKWPERLKTRTR